MSYRRIAVCLEVTPREAIASALDWPGWCRAGRDEGAALQALASYAERYAPVARHAGLSLPSKIAFDVLEQMSGGSPTAFAAPECRRPFPQVIAAAQPGLNRSHVRSLGRLPPNAARLPDGGSVSLAIRRPGEREMSDAAGGPDGFDVEALLEVLQPVP
jgi:hypothetical protein